MSPIIRNPPSTIRNLFLSLLFLLSLQSHAADPAVATNAIWSEPFTVPDKDSPEVAWWRDSMKTRDERLAWWREARFGMFIHWGVYSSLGNEFHGQRGGTYAEHIQRVLKISIPVYRSEVAGNFNPTNFDADTWVRLAKAAGMGYIVITSKHHDGFAMWPTKVNNYNIMDATPWHHDPMKDLKAACDKYGLKFGFYYSQAFDWGNENAAGNDWDYQNPGGDKHLGGIDWWNTRPEFMFQARKYVDEKAIPQLQELIRLYHPAILWFDTAGKLPPAENLRIMKAVRAADPDVVISGRLVHGWGDYDDTTDRPAEFPPHAGDWEGIPTTDESYGWSKFDHSHKPPSHFIRLLAKAAARGGNLLMNVGPMGTGEIDPNDVTILKGIADWWQSNGASIRGTTRTPLPVQTWGESTRKSNTLYLHVFDWPTNGNLVVGGLKTKVTKAYWLPGSLNKEIKLYSTSSNADSPDVTVQVPNEPPDRTDSVIALECEGDIQADPVRLLQPAYTNEVLRAFDGELHGKGLKFGPGKKTDDYVMNWQNKDEFVSWTVRLNQPINYEVSVNYEAITASAGNKFTVELQHSSPSLPTQLEERDGERRGSLLQPAISGEVQAGKSLHETVGQLAIPAAGTYVIKVVANEINGGELFRLRSLELTPAHPGKSAP